MAVNPSTNGLSSVLSIKSNRVLTGSTGNLASLESTVNTHEARIDTAEADISGMATKINAGITTSVTVMINPTPTYKTLNFTNGILTSVV